MNKQKEPLLFALPTRALPAIQITLCGCFLNPFHLPSFWVIFFSLSPLLDKDLQLPSGFNCNFDFPEEPCGWMYDHAKWLRSTWTSNSNPHDRTFPGKPAASSEGEGSRLACCALFSPRCPCKLHHFPTAGQPCALCPQTTTIFAQDVTSQNHRLVVPSLLL